jgi:hypothetical protein
MLLNRDCVKLINFSDTDTVRRDMEYCFHRVKYQRSKEQRTKNNMMYNQFRKNARRIIKNVLDNQTLSQ